MILRLKFQDILMYQTTITGDILYYDRVLNIIEKYDTAEEVRERAKGYVEYFKKKNITIHAKTSIIAGGMIYCAKKKAKGITQRTIVLFLRREGFIASELSLRKVVTYINKLLKGN